MIAALAVFIAYAGVHHTQTLRANHQRGHDRQPGEDTVSLSLRSTNIGSSEMTERNPTYRLLILSAADSQGPKRQAQNLEKYLEYKESEKESVCFDQLCYTLIHRCSLLPWRSYVVAQSVKELDAELPRLISQPVRSPNEVNIVFVFTGQGAQWPGMSRDLEHYKVYRESLEAAGRYLKSLGCSWSLLGQLPTHASIF